MRNRRGSEHGQPYFAERFSSVAFVLVLLLLIFSLTDGFITVSYLEAGRCEELNPLMNWLLRKGLLPFFLGKYLLTAAGLPLLFIFKNWYLFGTRLRVGHILPILVILYAILLAYQLFPR